jgi:hypothetical protein
VECRIFCLLIFCPKIFGTTVLPILCGCETWALTCREEHQLSVSEDGLLKKKGGEVTGVPYMSGPSRSWNHLYIYFSLNRRWDEIA